MAALARKLAPKRKKSRKAPLLRRLQQFPKELLIDHIVVGDRQAMSHAGLHAASNSSRMMPVIVGISRWVAASIGTQTS